jgi:hypothetical protein
MSLRSMVRAGKDAYAASAKTSSDTTSTDVEVPRGSEFAAAVVSKAIEVGSDKYWDMLGGPWIAQYRRVAIAAAIGIGEGEPHEEFFQRPEDALEHFRQLPDRYRTNATLRHDCLITYKRNNFHCVEPFAEDADQALVVFRDECLRDEGRMRSGSQVTA